MTIDKLRTEMQTGFKEVREEMQVGFTDVRAEMKTESQHLRAEMRREGDTTRRHFDLVAEEFREYTKALADGTARNTSDWTITSGGSRRSSVPDDRLSSSARFFQLYRTARTHSAHPHARAEQTGTFQFRVDTLNRRA